ncbi:hypothetical protein [Gallibacterium anatis]|uniref:Uncharacterized protein n=1 Tax=Gallibacterium anatis TaxID=750 RepID=A0A0A2XQI4_9PAST|nr:hypothetical protein [Gallibacterium anatis]KGQ33192.1 hypothetical protein JP32_03015 [Gallibacterium anatis]
MASAKDILVKPIKSSAANALVKKVHYSGKVVQNSSLHFGVFLNGKLEGVMSFGSPMDKRKVLPLVKDTKWNGMLELNRMAFSDVLPRNSESRALSIAFRLIKKHYPHIEWILSFSDGTQCGDGTIYRASGFILTQINPNKTLLEFPEGTRIANMTLTANWDNSSVASLCQRLGVPVKARSIGEWRALGGKPLKGFQLRYIYFLNPKAKDRLTCDILPFSEIERMGAGMYKGIKK